MWMIVRKLHELVKEYTDLVMTKAPQVSGIIITNKNWHIVVDQYTGYKESEFYNTKSYSFELICKKFSK